MDYRKFKLRANESAETDNVENLKDFLVDKESRTIYLHGDITLTTGGIICNIIKKLDREDGDITIEINGLGGSWDASLAIISTINRTKNRVITDNVGIAGSACAYIFLSGDLRKMSHMSSLMFHKTLLPFCIDEDIQKIHDYTKFYLKEFYTIVDSLTIGTKITAQEFLENCDNKDCL